MFFGRFHVVIFREKRGTPRKLQLKGWMLMALGLVLTLLVAGNVILLRNFAISGSLEKSLSLTEKSAHEQKS
ncbi:MAG: peptidase M24, partial [Humidesulfovibrio sp.]|nr:peptidase M24 [Humidesulfovibrio sp.]